MLPRCRGSSWGATHSAWRESASRSGIFFHKILPKAQKKFAHSWAPKSSISRTPRKEMPSKIGGQDANKRPKDHKVLASCCTFSSSKSRCCTSALGPGPKRANLCSAVTRFTLSNSWKLDLQIDRRLGRSAVDKFRLSKNCHCTGWGAFLSRHLNLSISWITWMQSLTRSDLWLGSKGVIKTLHRKPRSNPKKNASDWTKTYHRYRYQEYHNLDDVAIYNMLA